MNLNFKSNLIIEIIEELGLLFQAPTVNPKLGSASDVTHTDLWLNVCCIWYTYLETLQECRSRVGLVELYRISRRRVCRVL